MLEIVEITANGTVVIGGDGEAVSFSVDDPAPKSVVDLVSAKIAEMQADGFIAYHSERSLHRQFTHLVAEDGSVQVAEFDASVLDALVPQLGVIAESVRPEPPAPDPSDLVDRERDRRILEGREFNVVGYGPVVIAGDDTTIRNLQGLALAAQMQIAAGDNTRHPWRDENNVIHQLLPEQLIDLWRQAVAYVSALFQAAWMLKDNPIGIPADYTDNKYWP